MFESSVGRKMWLQAVILPATLLEETRELCEKRRSKLAIFCSNQS